MPVWCCARKAISRENSARTMRAIVRASRAMAGRSDVLGNSPERGQNSAARSSDQFHMALFRLSHGLALALLLASSAAQAQPRIAQAADPAACKQALVIAKLAYESAAPILADAAPFILKDGK